MVRAPVPIVISSDEKEEVRRGEIDVREENSQRPDDGYTDYTRRVTMTIRIFDDRITNTRPPQQQQATENTTRFEEDHNIEENTALTLWLRQTGEPTTKPPGWRDFTNTDPLLTELIAKPKGK
ncbi:unnamed protein product [Ceratitis capitata]|uniref:(Mediterranean fruit fly) hypothetical protein n=1 Tax=Ceratitis capitata TaxID=7213 RepID=A0A811U9C3_CERCA|nr:unnamed protein product [Ceratitis capitata]